MSKWNATMKAAKSDTVLRSIATHIQKHNGEHRTMDRTAYGAFTDRVQELGLYVPAGYMTFVLGAAMPARS